MKKTLRIVAIAMVAVILCLSLASCGKKLSGKYEAEIGVSGLAGYTATYDFSGSKVEVTHKTSLLGSTKTTVLEGKYEITVNDDDTMEITITLEEENDDVKSGTYTFEEGEDYIKIGLVEYKKVD